MIQLFATDIDGTLLDENRFLSHRTIKTLKGLKIPKILISARMPQAMYYLQDALDILGEAMICYNGALVLHGDEVLFELGIPFDEVQTLAAIGEEHGLHVAFYRNEEWFVPALDHWANREINNTRVHPTVQSTAVTLDYLKNTSEKGNTHKVMFMGDEDAMDLAFAKAEKELTSKVHLYRSKNTYTEITPKGTSKEVALRKLLEFKFPDVAMKNVVAFGDNYNDTDMLKAVGYGVAVENGRDEVKNAAAYITAHHKKDGVAIWLEENA